MAPMLNEANAQLGDALAGIRAALARGGVHRGMADAAAVAHIGAAARASAQLLAFRDCFFLLGAGFLALAPVAILLPGRVRATQIG
jgi:hypothetical protein